MSRQIISQESNTEKTVPPSEWDEVKFNELMSSIQNGLYKKKEYYGEGTQIVKMGELFADQIIENKESMDRLELTEKEIKKHRLEKGDLLFARRSYVREGAGKCSIVGDLKETLVPESSIIRVRLHKGIVYPSFYLYYFQSPRGRYKISKIIRQTAVSGIAQSDLKEIVIPKPPLKVQKKIGDTLNLFDTKIETNNHIIQLLEKTAKAIFKRWFVDFEPYKEFEHNNDVEDEIPKGWEVKSLNEIADFLNGVAWQKYRAEEGEPFLPVIKIRELRDGFGENTDKASTEVPEEYIIEDGDVIFSWSGSLLVKLWTGGRGLLNQHLFKVSSDSYPKWFYYLWTLHHLRKFRHIAASKATTMGHIKRKDLEDALVLVPDEETLDEMSTIMAPFFKKMIVKGIESRDLASLRDTILPRLISGEIKVVNDGSE